jgi:hypothetical protein
MGDWSLQQPEPHDHDGGRARTGAGRGRGPGAAGGRARTARDQVVQADPLTVNAVGTASLAVQVPWKPSDVFALGAIVPL